MIVVDKNVFDPFTVIQGRANTCSVVVALINIANYFRMFKINLLRDLIHPQQVKLNNKSNKISNYLLYNVRIFILNQNGCAVLNPLGKYGVKLTVNGAKRYVELDDFVLTSTKPGIALFLFSLNFKN